TLVPLSYETKMAYPAYRTRRPARTARVTMSQRRMVLRATWAELKGVAYRPGPAGALAHSASPRPGAEDSETTKPWGNSFLPRGSAPSAPNADRKSTRLNSSHVA